MSVPTAPNIFIRPDCSESHRADFYWGPPTSDGGSPISSYTLTMTAPSSFSVSLPPTLDEYSLTGLTNGIQYTFTLTAENSNGSSPAATFRPIYPGINPGPIGDFYVQKESNKSGTVYYTESIGDGQGAPTIFNVVTGNTLDNSGNLITTSNSTILGALANDKSIYFNNLISSQTYSFTPQLINDPGYSILPKGTNPLFFASSMTTVFSPSSIAGLQTWLDASDPMYVFYSGGVISTIQDKASGLNYSSTPSTYTYPTYGSTINNLSTIYFTVQNGLQNDSGIPLSNITNLFLVGRERGDSNYGTYYPFLLGDDTTSYWHNDLGYYIGANINGSSGIQDSSGIFMTEMIADIVSTTASSIRQIKPGKTFLLNLNNITGSTDYKGIFYDRDLSQTLGEYRGWSGDFAEMLLYSSVLSQSDINSITQYLQEKWSTTPRTTNDLLCWIDASVSKNISTSSTSNINTIFDKGFQSSFTTVTSGVYYDPESESIFSMNNGYLNLADFALPYDNSSYTIFYVGSFNVLFGVYNVFYYGNLGGGSSQVLASYTDTATGKLIQEFGGDSFLSLNSINTSNQYVFTFTYDNKTNTRYTYINGQFEGSNVAAAPRNNAPLSNYIGNPFNINGSLNEFIVFGKYLTNSERETIEKNLGQKWEVFPFYEPPYVNFNPRNITGLQLWLDGKDNSNYILSNSYLQYWNDKSGFSRDASGVGINGPLQNDYTQLFTFPGYDSNARLYLPDNTFPISSPFTFFMMANITDTFQKEFIFSVGAEDISGQFNIWREAGNQYTSWSNISGQMGSPCPNGGNRIFTFTYTPGQRSMYFNGELAVEDVQNSRVISSISTFIGGYANPNGIDYSSGSVGEFVLYNKLLDPNELEVTTSYLKQKWGIEPQIDFTIQSLSSNIRAWYDASSPEYFILSGSNITTWLDRSGNGRHGSGSNLPVYDSTSNAVFFQTGSNSYIDLPNNTIPSSNAEYDIFAVFQVFDVTTSFNTLISAGDSLHTSLATYQQNIYYYIDNNSLAYAPNLDSNLKYVFRGSYKPGRRGIMFNTKADIFDSIGSNTLIENSNAIGILRWNDSLPFYGNIHEIIIFDRRLTYTEGLNVSYQLQKKWGITYL